MSKTSILSADRECANGCRSVQHGDALTAVISKRGISGDLVASYMRWLCTNCGQIVDSNGRTALHFAASCGRKDISEWLIKFKEADINSKDKESGYTALHRSIFYGQLHVAIPLIQLGANLNITDYDGLTPIDHAMKDRLPYISYNLHSPCDVYVWGTNSNYTLGIGNQQQRTHPDVLDVFRKQNISITQVVMAKFHSVFVSCDGKVFSCGHGHGGRLGLDSDQAYLSPKQVKLPTNHVTNKPEVCVKASIGKDHTVLLMETGLVLTCGLNTHHQLGHSPPPPYLLTPRAISQKVLRSAGGVITGICAARFHTVLWSDTTVMTCGLNAGQLGHPKLDGKTVVVPKQVTVFPNKEFHITHVTASDAATVIATKEGSIFILHEYQCKRIAIKQINVHKVEVVGGELDAKVHADILTDRGGEDLCIAILTKDGAVLLWQSSFLQFKRLIFVKNRSLYIKDINFNKNHLLLVTNDGELYQTDAKTYKSKKSLKEVKPPMLDSPPSKKSAILDKNECYPLKLQRLQYIHRAVSVSSDPKGRNFAVIQVSPKEGLIEVPQVDTSDMKDHLKHLLEEAHEDDCIHDVEFQVGPALRKFFAHQYVIAFQSSHLMKLIAEQCIDSSVPKVKLENIHPKIFEQILLYIYTGTCDLLIPGPCNIRILREEALKYNLCSFANESNDCKQIVQVTNNKPTKAHQKNLSHSIINKKISKQKNIKEAEETKDDHDENEDTFCNPVRMVQEASKKLGVMLLHKKLDGVIYEFGHITSKSKKIGKVVVPTFLRKKHQDLCDVTIKSEDGKELKAHRCILASRLDYFYSMFSRGWVETSNTKALSFPLPYNILEVLVNFLYEDNASSLQDSEDLDFLANVLIVADQFFITRLKEICEVVLAGLLTLKNVAQVFNFSGTYNADQLKKCCINFISINLPAILESRILEKMNEDLLEELSKSYCEMNPVIRSRVITPVPTAPSDSIVQTIWETYPMSFENESVDGKNKDKYVKKKPRLRKISSSESNKLVNEQSTSIPRTRQESVSSNEEQDFKELEPVDFEFFEDHCSSSVTDVIDNTSAKFPKDSLLKPQHKENSETSWVKITSHTIKQKKALAARLKVISAVRDDLSMLQESPMSFTKLTSSIQNIILKETNHEIKFEGKARSPPLQDIHLTNIDFPELQRSPPQHENVHLKTTPKQNDMKKISKLPQKLRKRLASDHDVNSEQVNRTSTNAWQNNTNDHVSGSPTTYSLLDVMRLSSRQITPAIPIPDSKQDSNQVIVHGTSPTVSPGSPSVPNPWTRLETCSPTVTHIDATPSVSFSDIVADEKKQRDNWTRMRTKPLQLTQMEDQAIQDLVSFYSVDTATEERITVRRVLKGVVAAPVWVTSHH